MKINSTAVSNLPIPSEEEEGIQIAVNTLFLNLNDEIIKLFKLYLFLSDNLK